MRTTKLPASKVPELVPSSLTVVVVAEVSLKPDMIFVLKLVESVRDIWELICHVVLSNRVRVTTPLHSEPADGLTLVRRNSALLSVVPVVVSTMLEVSAL